MALIRCDECGKEISDKAAACPGCGYPIIDLSSRSAKNAGVDTTLTIVDLRKVGCNRCGLVC